MLLHRLISCRGKPYKIWSDHGANFRGRTRELQEAFADMEHILQEQLEEQRITFRFYPPHAPHFGGAWEREIRSAKPALQVIKDQIVPEVVLLPALIEEEGILNSKPLSYVSLDIGNQWGHETPASLRWSVDQVIFFVADGGTVKSSQTISGACLCINTTQATNSDRSGGTLQPTSMWVM